MNNSKNKKRSALYLACILFACVIVNNDVYARIIHNRHYKFTISLPDQLKELHDATTSEQSKLYYDTATGVILMISARESKFRSVSDYLDCTREQLERQLKNNYGDTTLQLITCTRSDYYPKKTTELHFRVSAQPSGYNTYIIYFIHHRHKDIQISFTYKMQTEQQAFDYIRAIMQTLKLK